MNAERKSDYIIVRQWPVKIERIDEIAALIKAGQDMCDELISHFDPDSVSNVNLKRFHDLAGKWEAALDALQSKEVR